MAKNQRDAAMMLHSTDPLPNSHSETPLLPGNMINYINFPSSSGLYSDALTANSQCQSSYINGQPVASDSNVSQQQEVLLKFGSSGAAENHLRTWKDGRNEMLMMHSARGGPAILQGAPSFQGQELSLSLSADVSSVMQMPSIQYQNGNPDFSPVLRANTLIPGEDRARNISFDNENSFHSKKSRNSDYMLSGGPRSISYMCDKQVTNNIPTHATPSITRAVIHSKYLKAAQQLVDEVVNVKEAIIEQNAKKELAKDSKAVEGESGDRASDHSAANASGNCPNELSVAEKQEWQNKMTKLLSMLDEAGTRYRQYYQQMQIVVSSFDMIAGPGASKPYTALALQTISRHFRCLCDVINGQVHVARTKLKKEDASSNDKGIKISCLRDVDRQLTQQRTLQQLGLMQQLAWRPQRGLPETSVSILRAWLFEHFLHPYPKDSDKIMLARQTGLTRSQVSNWFINARVRLWKPMIEEMYKEEIGDADMGSNSSSETMSRAVKSGTKASEDKVEDLQQTATSTGRVLETKSYQMIDAEMMGSDTNPIFQRRTQAKHQNNNGIGETR